MATSTDDRPVNDGLETPKKSKKFKEIDKRPPIDALDVEMGTEGLPFTTPFQAVAVNTRGKVQADLQEVMREEGDERGPSIAQLVTMRRMDGQARALFRLLTLPIRASLTNSAFVAADGGEAEAQFITDVFSAPPSNGGMTVTFHRFMSQLLSGLFDGFSAFEKVFWIPPKGPLEGKVTLRKLAYRPSDTVTFVSDKNGGFAGFRQRTWNVLQAGKPVDVYIAPEYSFYYAANEEERKFYGVSFFQSAYYHYDKKVKLYFTAHMAAQRAAVGTRIGTVPGNASPAAKREFQQALANLIFAQSIMVPEGFAVDVKNESASFDFLSMVNHHNNQMSKSILAGFFDKETGAGANEGSLVNFAQPGDDMFMLMLRAIQDEIANQINHYLIPQLVDFNFEGGNYPTFTWGKLSDEQKAAISATFDKLASAETVTPEFIRSLEQHQAVEFGIDVDYDAVEEREALEKQMEQTVMGVGAEGNPLPMPTTDPNMAIPEGAEDQVESLDDVVSLLVAKAEMAAGIANAEGNPAPPTGPAGPMAPVSRSKPGARPASNIQPKKPAAPPGSAQPPGAPDAPGAKPKKPKTIGLSDELIDFADTMIHLSEGDHRDG